TCDAGRAVVCSATSRCSTAVFTSLDNTTTGTLPLSGGSTERPTLLSPCAGRDGRSLAYPNATGAPPPIPRVRTSFHRPARFPGRQGPRLGNPAVGRPPGTSRAAFSFIMGNRYQGAWRSGGAPPGSRGRDRSRGTGLAPGAKGMPMAALLRVVAPGGPVPQHRAEQRQQRAHAGEQDDLLRLARGAQPPVARAEAGLWRVAT